MASLILPTTLLSLLITFSIFSSFAITETASSPKDPTFFQNLNPKILGLGKQKLTRFRLYWHDIVSGPNPTVVPVVQPLNTSATAFGGIYMIDDPLTAKPEVRSKLVGRAQGFYAAAAQEEVGLLMSMNFAFTEEKYNGSTIAVLGRNTVLSKVREMPVIGGSGLFRFARGYVQARTHSVDAKTADAIVEYTCYILH